jgi:DNA modification methylase
MTQIELEKGTRRKKRANDLDGKEWTSYSISIWSDIRKSKEEHKLEHPAIFPVALASRLISIFTNEHQKMILDPFAGVGSTLIAAKQLNKNSIGLEISENYCSVAESRLQTPTLFDSGSSKIHLLRANALNILNLVPERSVDLVITSPPYWDILSQKRTADYKDIRDYGDQPDDLGKIKKYTIFIDKLKEVFTGVHAVMRAGAYCCVIVMDLRKKDLFFPFHIDVAQFMREIGFIFDDIIIWDRRHEYNNMRPLGYPAVFRINKAHEFILIFRKPK